MSQLTVARIPAILDVSVQLAVESVKVLGCSKNECAGSTHRDQRIYIPIPQTLSTGTTYASCDNSSLSCDHGAALAYTGLQTG